MTKLSQAAQAVVDAYDTSPFDDDLGDRVAIAASLRAAAEVFREAYANDQYLDHPDDFLFDIASELEGAQ